MVKFICSFAERMLTGVTGFLLVFALIVGMSQHALADAPLPTNSVPANCDPNNEGICASCAIRRDVPAEVRGIRWVVARTVAPPPVASALAALAK